MTSSINDNNNNNFLYEDEETLIEGDGMRWPFSMTLFYKVLITLCNGNLF